MNLPKRLKRPKMGLRESSVIRCPGHLKWVRGLSCCIAGVADHACVGKIEAHHVRHGAGAGMGEKPSDSTAVPLCSLAHQLVHTIGHDTFEKRYKQHLSKTAELLWKADQYHRLKCEQARK